MAEAAAQGFQSTIDRIVQHLSSGSAKDAAAAAVTLALILQQSPPELPVDLSAAVQALAELLEKEAEPGVQRNAVAALSAGLEASDSAVQAAIENRVAERACSLLEEGVKDAGLELNLVVLLGTLGEASEATAQLVLDAGGLQQLLARAAPASDGQLLEAAVDGLCKLAANYPAAKDVAAAAGAIPTLAALLSAGSSGSSGGGGGEVSMDVQVRALLALGMLITDAARQLELAGAPGAVAALLRLMRQQEDADAQQIAAGMFRELAANPEAKAAVAAALKEQQAADAAAAKYV